MNYLYSRTSALVLLALLLVFVALFTNRSWAELPTLQSSASAPTTPCLTVTAQGFTFAFLGYISHPDGTTTLTYQVTNPHQNDIGYVALGTTAWTRRTPHDGASFAGGRGNYRVTWTNTRGNPGFVSVKYEAQFSGFSQGASDIFTLTVSNFDATIPVQAQAKAGRHQGTVTFTLADPACNRTPTPTPTPTPASPLPTPTPNPALTLDDYSFGEPRVVLTHTQNLLVLDWLSDNQRAIIVREDRTPEDFKQLIQVFNVATGEIQTYEDVNAMEPTAVWLADAEKMAFLAQQSGFRALYLSDTATQQSVEVVTGRLWPMIAANRSQVMVLASNQTAPLAFDSHGDLLQLPPINLHDYGINVAPAFGVALRWHPTESKVAVFDSEGFIVYDLETGNVQPYELDEAGRHWAYTGEWSPDGSKFGLNYVEGPPVFRLTQLAILDADTNEVRVISLPLTWISDIVWAQNSRQLIAAGAIWRQPKERAALYLVDIVTGETRELAQLEQLFWPNSQDGNLAWSPDDTKLLFRCRLSEAILPSALCESSVTVGGGQ